MERVGSRKGTARERPKHTAKKNRTNSLDFFCPWKVPDTPIRDYGGIEEWCKQRQKKSKKGGSNRRLTAEQKEHMQCLEKLADISKRCQAIEDLVIFIQNSLGDILPPQPSPSPPPPPPPPPPDSSTPTPPPQLSPSPQPTNEDNDTSVRIDVDSTHGVLGTEDDLCDDKPAEVDNNLGIVEVAAATYCDDSDKDYLMDQTEDGQESPSRESFTGPRVPVKSRAQPRIKLSYTQANITLKRPYGSAGSSRASQSTPDLSKRVSPSLSKFLLQDKTKTCLPLSNGEVQHFDIEKSRLLAHRRQGLSKTCLNLSKNMSSGEDSKQPSQQEIIIALDKAVPHKNSVTNGASVINADTDLRSRLVANVESKTNVDVQSKLNNVQTKLAKVNTIPLSDLLPMVESKINSHRSLDADDYSLTVIDAPNGWWENEYTDETSVVLKGQMDFVKSRERQEFLGPPPFKATPGRTPLHRARDSSQKRLLNGQGETVMISRKTRWPSSAVMRGNVRAGSDITQRQPSARKTNAQSPAAISVASKN